MKDSKLSKELFICDCHSTEHQLVFGYIPAETEFETDEIQIEVHLTQYRSFFHRVWVAIKYVFGYKSTYGHWDVFMVNPDDCDRFISKFQRLKNSYVKAQELRNTKYKPIIDFSTNATVSNTKAIQTTTNKAEE